MKKRISSLAALILSLFALSPLSAFAMEEPEQKQPLETALEQPAQELQEEVEQGSQSSSIKLAAQSSEALPALVSASSSLSAHRDGQSDGNDGLSDPADLPVSQPSALSITEEQAGIEQCDNQSSIALPKEPDKAISILDTLEEENTETELDPGGPAEPEDESDKTEDSSQSGENTEESQSPEEILYGWNGESYISCLTGQPVKGFLHYNGEVYYFDENGLLVRNQSRQIDGKTYRLDEEGKVYRGYLAIGDRNYYYSQYDGHQQSGKKLYNGQEIRLNLNPGEQGVLVDQDGQVHYVYSDGSRAINEVVEIDGQNYYFDGAGNKAIGQSVELDDGEIAYFDFKDGAQVDEKHFQVQSKAKEVINLVGTSLYDLFLWSSGLSYDASVPHNLDPIDYGLMAFENHSGNCYVYAAAFYYLADLLGYSIEYVRGQVLYNSGNVGDHAWTAIRDEDGKLYFYDPEGQYELGSATSFWHIDPDRPPIRYLYDASIL